MKKMIRKDKNKPAKRKLPGSGGAGFDTPSPADLSRSARSLDDGRRSSKKAGPHQKKRVTASTSAVMKELDRSGILDILPELISVGVRVENAAGDTIYENQASKLIWENIADVSEFQEFSRPGSLSFAGKFGARAPESIRGGWERVFEETIELQCFDSSYKTIDLSILELRGRSGVGELSVVISQDVTGLREAEEGLRSTLSSYRGLAALSNEGLFVTDKAFRITHANPRFAEMIGRPAEALAGRGLGEISASGVPEALAALPASRSAGPVRFSHVFSGAGGRPVHAEMTASCVLSRDGSFDGVIASARDVTESARLAETIDEIRRELAEKCSFEDIAGKFETIARLAGMLPAVAGYGRPSGTTGGAPPGTPTLEDTEKKAIVEALARNRGNRGKAAAELGINRVLLWRRMKKHSLL